MMTQPAQPAAPAAPAVRTEVGVPDGLTKRIDDVNKAVEEAGRRAEARAAAGAGPTGNSSVVKDAGGRIVVTGPNGKTVIIDPRVGLDGDQIEGMVRTALQPTEQDSRPGIPKEVLPILAMAFTFLLLVVWMISRAISGRRRTVAPTTAMLPPEATARLARIEQAVEAVAIEVERISEAQRYSAQLLTDRASAPAAPAITRTVDASPVRG